MFNRPKLWDWQLSGGGSNPITPTINYNFLNGTLPSGLTFSRASSAYYYNSAGILTAASSNTPRFDYNPTTLALNGLLLEGQSTNYSVPSNSTTTGSDPWNGDGGVATITTDAAISPDGTTNASQWTVSNIGARYYCDGSSGTSGIITASCYLKYNSWRYVYLFPFFETSTSIIVDMLSREILYSNNTLASSIELLPNGWMRVQFTYNEGSLPFIVLGFSDGSNSINPPIVGDNVSNFYQYGMQTELGYGATSYMPTTNASVTRASDILTGATSGYFNPSAGSMTVKVLKQYNDLTYTKDVQFDDGTDNNRQVLYANQASYDAASTSAGTSTYINGLGTITEGTAYTAGMTWNNTTIAACFNGGTVQSASASLPTGISTLRFSDTTIDNNPMNGWLQSFKYWNTALTNSQLQQVTT